MTDEICTMFCLALTSFRYANYFGKSTSRIYEYTLRVCPARTGQHCVCVCVLCVLCHEVLCQGKNMMGFGKMIWCLVTAQHTLQ